MGTRVGASRTFVAALNVDFPIAHVISHSKVLTLILLHRVPV